MTASLLGLVAACVSRVPVAGAPCPCPEGTVCCVSSAQCLPQGAACAETYPASSRAPCLSDGDCTATGELCESWTVEGSPAGPGECRRDCTGGLTCSEGERCGLAPHDLHPLQELHVARMCVSLVPAAGCENQGCYDCQLDQLGKSYCVGNQVQGWFLAIHPQCGLTCRSLLLDDCGPVPCAIEAGKGAVCQGLATYDSPCLDLACSACEREPGSFFCDGADLAVCVSMSTSGMTCSGLPCQCTALCSRQVVRSCGSCVESSGVPVCGADSSENGG